MEKDWRPEQARKALQRILPRVEKDFEADIREIPRQWEIFVSRLHSEWERLFICLYELYGWQYDFFYTLECVLSLMAKSWAQRPAELRKMDTKRQTDPHWYLSEKMIGAVLYVDLFADNLGKLKDHIGYFKRLGLSYLHLMPLFATPREENDGGYAVSDYRAINPDIGTMEDMVSLATTLRNEGISLVLDFVFNHTSDEHIWAQKAREGDPDFQNYYYTFPDRELPDRFQEHLRDIFPSDRKGSFTYCAEMERFVWTTFNDFQWDLNYSNPQVFCSMAEEMLFLANLGVEVLRLDAVAFIWKRLGTNCENLPEAHTIIRAFNSIARITAPALLFKSEAIVHPDEVVRYVHPEECHFSYNPLMMAMVWEALATRDVRLLTHSIHRRNPLPHGCTWVNYLRCHDDIGWTFDDEDARSVGIDPMGHRRFLNDFYTGRYPGSFAKGMPFQHNPETGDLRISGTLSSLAGLEEAVEKEDNHLIETAVKRINMLRNILITSDGIPLLYIGDEWGMLNDYTYLSDPRHAGDSRWVHRSKKRWEAGNDLTDADTLEWRFFHEMVKLVTLRKQHPAFRNGGMEVIDAGTRHVFGYIRAAMNERILILNNFSEYEIQLDTDHLAAYGIRQGIRDIYSGTAVNGDKELVLAPYAFMWLDISSGI